MRLAFQGTTAQQLVQLGALESDPFAGSRDVTFSLVKSDRMFQGKVQILADMGMQPEETFPVYEDRMPAQLLPYLRLSRIQEADDFAKVRPAGLLGARTASPPPQQGEVKPPVPSVMLLRY